MSEATMRERKKEATRDAILMAAIDLINENGFAETTMQAIARRADVALRTLYNYFPTKESIVATYIRLAVQTEVDKAWSDVLEIDTTYERLVFICRRSAEWMRQNVTLIEVYASDPRNYIYGSAAKGIPQSGFEEVVTRIMELGQQAGDVTVSVPAEVLARQYMGFYYYSVLTWLGDTGKDLFEIFNEGLSLFYRGIMPDRADSGDILRNMFW